MGDLPKTRSFNWIGKTYTYECTECNIEDTVRLQTAIVTQAIKDYIFYYDISRRTTKAAEEAWETANSLLFDDDYAIQYGDIELSTKDLVSYVLCKDIEDFDIENAREDIVRRAKEYWELKI